MRTGPGFAALLLVVVLEGCPGPDPAPLCDPIVASAVSGYSDADRPVPQHFRISPAGTVVFSDNTPPENPITNAGAVLGRVLFYDPRLSADNRVSCSSCHRQVFGFGDTGRTSRGVGGSHPGRRIMALGNARFNARGRLFWDERAPSLEAQVLMPIEDSLEMGIPLDSLVGKLSATSYYPGLFAAAFGSPEVTRQGIARALAQFVRALTTTESRFDAMFATGGAPDSSRLTAEERDGFRLFNRSGCVNCHRTIAQFADQANAIGLDSLPGDTGAGQGRFKPASLRNVAVRPPYMHDGRFATLRDVVEFYARGVREGPWLDPRLRSTDGTPRRLALTAGQVSALVAFLESLTDTVFLRDSRFASPFPCPMQ